MRVTQINVAPAEYRYPFLSKDSRGRIVLVARDCVISEDGTTWVGDHEARHVFTKNILPRDSQVTFCQE